MSHNKLKSSRLKPGRRGSALSLLGAICVVLTACAGLPTSGSPQAGLVLADSTLGLELTLIPDGPSDGAGPIEIVEGFLEAAISPADGWAIARQFLTPEFAGTWQAAQAVTIDEAAGVTRTLTSTLLADDLVATGADVKLSLQPIASIDMQGSYSVSPSGSAEALFRIEKNAAGQWRIASAPDGILLDEDTFREVYRRHDLQYFDLGYQQLVPDVRWFPRRSTIVTSLTQALIAGTPSQWLQPVVRTAFPPGVFLARDAVPIDSAQVAEVSLSEEALSLDTTTLSLMRVQLERSLAGTGVSSVRFSVDGRQLDTEPMVLDSDIPVAGTVIENDLGFGLAIGEDIERLPEFDAAVDETSGLVLSADFSADLLAAAVLQDGEGLIRATGGLGEVVDSGPDLIPPSLDRFGRIWSASAQTDPQIRLWEPSTGNSLLPVPWSEASAVEALRVSPEGSRLAAVLVIGSARWIVAAGIIRGESGTVEQIGPFEKIAQLPGPVSGLVWLGNDMVAALTSERDRTILMQQILGGPSVRVSVPQNTISISGALSASGIRLLSDTGVVFVARGAAWQEELSGVTMLATRSGQ